MPSLQEVTDNYWDAQKLNGLLDFHPSLAVLSKNEKGYTLLHKACEKYEDTSILKRLLRAPGSHPLVLELEAGESLVTGSVPRTPVLVALRFCNINALKLLSDAVTSVPLELRHVLTTQLREYAFSCSIMSLMAKQHLNIFRIMVIALDSQTSKLDALWPQAKLTTTFKVHDGFNQTVVGLSCPIPVPGQLESALGEAVTSADSDGVYIETTIDVLPGLTSYQRNSEISLLRIFLSTNSSEFFGLGSVHSNGRRLVGASGCVKLCSMWPISACLPLRLTCKLPPVEQLLTSTCHV